MRPDQQKHDLIDPPITNAKPQAKDAPVRLGQPRESTAQRRCIACALVGSNETMLRFVLAPEGVSDPAQDGAKEQVKKKGALIVFDLLQNLPGRGYWLCAKRDCLAQAIAKKAFARAARQPVQLPDGFEALVVSKLRQQALKILSLLRRAGQVIAGGDKLEQLLRKSQTAFAALTLDSSDETRKQVLRWGGPERINPFPFPLYANEVGPIFGREFVAQIGFQCETGLTRKLKTVMRELDGLLQQQPNLPR